MIKKYDFHKNKYGSELLIDLIPLHYIKDYILSNESHRLSYFDITILEDGSGNFSIDNNSVNIEEGVVIFTSPMQIRKWNTTECPKGWALLFEEEFLSSFFNDKEFVKKLSYFNQSGVSPFLITLKEESSELIKIFISIRDEIEKYNNCPHLLRAILYQLLIKLDKLYLKKFKISSINVTSGHINKFRSLVGKHYKEIHSVNEYAKMLNITSGHLNDLSKNNLGIQAKSYINNKRIHEAKRLLRYTDMSISEISWHLKFQETSYFIRSFKKHIGKTPLQFKKQNNP